MLTPERVLVLSPHTDDAELGCGGVLSRFLRQGSHVKVITFSQATESVPAGYPPDCLAREFMESMHALGLPDEDITLLNFPVRRFPDHRQEILEIMVSVKRAWSPDLVFVPTTLDVHQDHGTISQEGIRAFKDGSILGFESPWNQMEGRSQVLIELTVADLENKIKILQCYESQISLHRSYFSRRFLEGLAMVRGLQCKKAYAESFEAIRLAF